MVDTPGILTSLISKHPPSRIISLVPSGTEMLCRLGLIDSIVGVSHACDIPANVVAKPKLTRARVDASLGQAQIDASVRTLSSTGQSLYELDRDLLTRLKPDLIVMQGVCPVCAVDERDVLAAAASLHPQPEIFRTQPARLSDVISEMLALGNMTDRATVAEHETRAMRQQIQALVRRNSALPRRPTVLLLEWTEPFFAAGHWNPELIALAGGIPSLGQPGEPSRQVTLEQIAEADPDLIVCAPCGLELDRSRAALAALTEDARWRDLRAVRTGRTIALDGSSYFNRPGPRLIDSLELLVEQVAEVFDAGIKSVAR